MPSIEYIKGSNGVAETVRAVVTGIRSIGGSVITVNSIVGINSTFIGTTGGLDANGELTIRPQVFYGSISGSDLVIDSFATGYTDLGNLVGDIVVIKPTTAWADETAAVLGTTLNDNGTLKRDAIDTAATSNAIGLFKQSIYYTANDTYTKPAGLKFVVVEAVAGGAGGGGVGTTAGNGFGGGGAGGNIARGKVLAASLSGSTVVTVATTAAGGVGNATGTSGGTSSFGAFVVATGNTGGSGSAGNTDATGGNVSLGASVGDSIVPGEPGNQSGGSRAGNGGGNGAGRGAAGAGNGESAVGNYGGGGAGATDTGTTSRNGGAGAAGLVIVHEYF